MASRAFSGRWPWSRIPARSPRCGLARGEVIHRHEREGWAANSLERLTIREVATKTLHERLLIFTPVRESAIGTHLFLPVLAGEPFTVELNGRLVFSRPLEKGEPSHEG